MEPVAGMRLFTSVVAAGSLSEAARRAGLTPATMSRRLASLEDSLGVRLLNRTTRMLSLTEAGQVYLSRAKRILADVEETHQMVTQLEKSPQGTLRVHAPRPFGQRRIAPAIREYCRRFPGVTVELTLMDALIDLMEAGADIAIRIGQLSDSGSSMIARRLGENRRTICATPEFLAEYGRPKRPGDLGRFNCLIYRFHQGQAVWHLKSRDGVVDVPVSGTFGTNDAEALRAAMLTGLGIGLLSDWMIADDIASGRLERLLPDWEATPSVFDSAIYAVYPPGRHLSSKIRTFVDFLAECFGNDPSWVAPAVGGR